MMLGVTSTAAECQLKTRPTNKPATLFKEWTADQIRSFQDYFDALMSGNLARRRQTKFMPADFKLIEARQPPLKDQYDEWLARIICYAFSVPVSPFCYAFSRPSPHS